MRQRIRSFGHAGVGVANLVRGQRNAQIHAVATVLVVTAGFGLGVTRLEWCALILAMAIVWSAEGLNTAVERLADAAVPGLHPLVRQAKDVAAGAVLLAALGAGAVGLLVLGPHVLALLAPGAAG